MLRKSLIAVTAVAALDVSSSVAMARSPMGASHGSVGASHGSVGVTHGSVAMSRPMMSPSGIGNRPMNLGVNRPIRSAAITGQTWTKGGQTWTNWHHRHHHRFAGVGFGVGFGLGLGFADWGYYDSCWRWVATPYGLQQVYVCGYPYGPYGWY
jgi:hypothetical protein